MFSDTVLSLSNGATVADLNNELKKVVAAVRATSKAGSLTLKLKVIPGSKNSTEIVFVEPEIKCSLPTRPKEQTLFYTTDDDTLTRQNERQRDLFADSRVIEVHPGNRDAGSVKEIAS